MTCGASVVGCTRYDDEGYLFFFGERGILMVVYRCARLPKYVTSSDILKK